jgi:hypothetical protein
VRHCQKSRLGWLLVVVCAAAVPYATLGVTLEGALFWPTPAEFLEAARAINTESPTRSVIAIHPDDETPAYGYWLRRRQVATYERVALLFGATSEEFQVARQELRDAYAATRPSSAEQLFSDLGADVIIVDKEGASGTPGWARQPCFEAQHRGGRFDVYRRVPECGATESR